MLGLLKKLTGSTETVPADSDSDGREAAVALCVLLLEAAHADGECSDEEMEHVVETLVSQGDMAREDLAELIDRADRERGEAIDLFTFTRYLNEHFSQEQKLEVMEAVWRVIHTDGRLEAHEDQFAHKCANLLRLSQKELIDAKIRARQPAGGGKD